MYKIPCSYNWTLKCFNELVWERVPITNIGTRHGEKIYETLVSKEDMLVSEI